MAVAVAGSACTGASTTQGLLTHRAVYDLSLQTRGGPSSVGAARGLLITSFEDGCDNWVVRQGMVLAVGDADKTVTTTSFFVSHEDKAGQWYSFKDETTTGDGATDTTIGRASLSDHKVSLTKPKAATSLLPAGTVFPTAQLIDILRGAEAGKQFLSHVVYDGTDGATAYDVSTVIGRKRSSPRNGLPEWPVELAFFAHGSTAELPDLEINALLRQDGVAEDLGFDYGDFAIHATLKELKPLPSGC